MEDIVSNAAAASSPTSRRNMIKAGAATGIVAVGLPSAAAAVSVDGAGALVATGGFDTPTSVTAEASSLVSRAINVSWAAVTGATEYQVKYRVNATSEPFTVAGTSEETTLQVTNLTAGTTYQFVVVATNGTSVSFDSAPATATAVQLAPGVPTNISATGTNGAVDVSWAPPTTGGAVTTYEVRWSATDGSGWTTITGLSSSTSSQTVSGLTNGTTYYFQVRGINAANGEWSSSVSAVPAASAETQIAAPPAPQPPVLGATTTSNSVTIYTDSNSTPTWTYTYSRDNGENWISAGVDATTTTFTVSSINGSSQTIKVRKENGGVPSVSTVSLTRQTPTYSTGQVYSVVNPDSTYGVRGITFSVTGGTGGKGGNDGNSGGNGGKPGIVAGSFTLGSDETLFIGVGGGGAAGRDLWNDNNGEGGGLGGTNPFTGYAGGRGGNSHRYGSSGAGGGGGAATVLKKGATGAVTASTAPVIVVAAGGGGGGGANSRGSGGGYAGSTVTGGNTGSTSGTNGGRQNGGNDDGGGGGAGGGGAVGGLGGNAQQYDSSGMFTTYYYYRGYGGRMGTNSVDGAVTATSNGIDSATLVNSAAGSVGLNYLAVSWTNG